MDPRQRLAVDRLLAELLAFARRVPVTESVREAIREVQAALEDEDDPT